ncbi:N-acetylmuramoyl-L-alanine amidase [bacterium]|nr:N-acetylmuramoyl-L-alanine amidase [bacterium]MBU1993089.1 N-acetylmuramoyl-L-alanine amidase [bacterium]
MIRWWTLVFIFSISLHALSDSEVLKRADGFMQTGTKSDQFRAYNDYKNLYLRAIMSNDDKLRFHSLQGIVSSGRKLHIDVSQYSKELSSDDFTHSYQQPISKSISKTKDNENIKVTSSNKLESVLWKDERLVLKFDNELALKQINYFTLYDSKNQKYKYVFDIHASMLSKSKNLRKDGITRIKVAQYDSSTIRLVIENNEKLDVKFKNENNELIINIEFISQSSTDEAEKIVTPTRVDRNKIIVIDAGHGGKDPGAVGYKRYREKVIVLQIAQELSDILRVRGYQVYMTRNSDTYTKLSYRTEYANEKNADIFVSIHANAAPEKNADKAQGIECYFLSPSRSDRATSVAEKENSADMSDMNKYGKESFLNFLNHHKILASNKLAIDLQRGMLSSANKLYSNVHDGGVREGPFWVLVGAQMPAVLVEVGFITHKTEAIRLVDSEYQNKLALGMADGIERYFKNN